MNKIMPQRRCIGCMTSFDKDKLLKITKAPDGKVFFDKKGNADGRGAYICKNEDCLNKAIKANRFSRALKVQVTEEIYNILKGEICSE